MQKNDSTQIVIGLGTGRCGTQSLAKLLNHQLSSEVYHEKSAHLIRWEGSETAICQFLEWAKTRQALSIVGDIGFYYLPYAEYILARYPMTKFICMQRDKAATVASYMRKTPKRNHWQNHKEASDWVKDKWDYCYRKYEAPNKESALSLYWHDYYEQATILQKCYPKAFKIFPLEALNSQSGQEAILSFLNIKKEDYQLQVGLKANAQQKAGHQQIWYKNTRWILALYRYMKHRLLQ